MAPALVSPSLTPLPESKLPSSVLHRTLHTDPQKVTSAKGLYLTLANGQRILDATGGAAVSCLGHGDERVKAAVMDQMDKVAYCHSLFYGTDAVEELATELVGTTGGEMGRAFFVSSGEFFFGVSLLWKEERGWGSEAMEAAVKMARQYFLEVSPAEPKRVNFIARKESYHGTTLGSLSVGGHRSRRALFEPMLLQNVSWVSPCNAYRFKKDGESVEQYVARLAEELNLEFQRLGSETVCAFVAEPIVGAALGCVPSVPGYFAAMRDVCRKHGALLIMDEVMSGCGRTGTIHAWQAPEIGFAPDIQTLGKALGGGHVPVAAMLVNKRVVDTLQKGTGAFSHGQTYQGHPVACRAALETLRIIKEENLIENVATVGRYMGQLLEERVGILPYVGNIRGKGFFWGIEFVKDKTTKQAFPPKLGIAMGVHELGLQEPYNISIYPGTGTVDGREGDHVLLAPPYTASKEDVEMIVDLTARVIKEHFDVMEQNKLLP
ncbi:aminotransferase class-III-like protein 2 [Elsinoe australis]|uniref:Aminotransferase class-III-like protein 2 n=1 Tax=Elsinoe australis TaxID=40998 RepID=A0A4U7ANF6_9PEZI|nr:aminotransferase class-III-like protein 2 [Elsinoe australis]